jgi:hypothetical protein
MESIQRMNCNVTNSNTTVDIHNSGKYWIIFTIVSIIFIFIIVVFVIWNYNKPYRKLSYDKQSTTSNPDYLKSNVPTTSNMRGLSPYVHPKNRSGRGNGKYRSVKLVVPMPTILETSAENYPSL